MYLLFLYLNIKESESDIYEKEEIIESIEKIKDISEKLLKAKEETKDEELENIFIN